MLNSHEAKQQLAILSQYNFLSFSSYFLTVAEFKSLTLIFEANAQPTEPESGLGITAVRSDESYLSQKSSSFEM